MDEPFELQLDRWICQVIEGKNPFGNIPEKKLHEMYALAFALYKNKRYLESSYFFRLLVVAKPADPIFWKGFGASLQMQKNFEEALNCYLCCAHLTDKTGPDPSLYIHAADCYFALKETQAGLQALDAAKSYAKKKGNEAICKQADFMKQQWSKNLRV